MSYSFSDAYVAIGDDTGIPPDRHCGVSGEAFALAQAQKVPLIYYSDRYFEGSGKGFELFYYVLDESFSEGKCESFRLFFKKVIYTCIYVYTCILMSDYTTISGD